MFVVPTKEPIVSVDIFPENKIFSPTLCKESITETTSGLVGIISGPKILGTILYSMLFHNEKLLLSIPNQIFPYSSFGFPLHSVRIFLESVPIPNREKRFLSGRNSLLKIGR